MRNNGSFYLDAKFVTLATVLHEAGYRTAAFISAFVLDRRYGLARGFDTYNDHLESGEGRIVNGARERRGDRTALRGGGVDRAGREQQRVRAILRLAAPL